MAGIDKIIRKGTDSLIDSYSAFYDNAHRKATPLVEYLAGRGVGEVFVMGLPTDYCVKFTALDALGLGYRTHVVIDGCRGVNVREGDAARAIEEMATAGAVILTSRHLLETRKAA